MTRFLLLLLLASSCAPAYLPNSRNVSLFGEQGEAMVTVAAGSAFELQSAYALTDHVGIMANGSIFNKKQTDDNIDYNRNYRFAEAGLGLFNKTRSLRSEVYAGYGLGQGTSYKGYYFYNQNGAKPVVAAGKYNRIFVQPSVGTNNRNFNLAFSMRFSMVDFTEFESGGLVVRPNEKPQLFIEPSLTSTFKLVGNLKGFFQLNLNNPVPSDPYFDFVNFQASIGIQLHTGSLRTRVY
jgi:hypothetical protein